MSCAHIQKCCNAVEYGSGVLLLKPVSLEHIQGYRLDKRQVSDIGQQASKLVLPYKKVHSLAGDPYMHVVGTE